MSEKDKQKLKECQKINVKQKNQSFFLMLIIKMEKKVLIFDKLCIIKMHFIKIKGQLVWKE